MSLQELKDKYAQRPQPITTPPQPLQPGDKVLVEAKYRQPFMGHGEVLFHLPDGNHACIVVQQSSIRPFPQEEE